MINPSLLEPEVLERICQKSIKATGKKWVWRRIADKHGLTVEQIEQELDTKIQRNEEYIKQLEEHFGQVRGGNARESVQQLGSTTGGSDTQRAEEYFGGITVERDGQVVESEGIEVRSEQTQDGPVTTEGSE